MVSVEVNLLYNSRKMHPFRYYPNRQDTVFSQGNDNEVGLHFHILINCAVSLSQKPICVHAL